MKKRRLHLTAMPCRQRGMATILIALFIGVAVTATSLSILHSISGTQERQMSVHAQTHVQNIAWAGVEALRLHFQGKDQAAMDLFNETHNAGGTPVVITGVGDEGDSLTARVTHYEGVGVIKIKLDIAARDLSAGSASNMQVLYEVTPGVNPGSTWDAAVQLWDKTNSTGGSTINVDSTDADGVTTVGADMMVDGDYTVTTASVGTTLDGVALNSIQASGDVTVDSAVEVKTILANGTITINSSSGPDTIKAAGDISLGEDRGKVVINSSATFGTIEANGNVDVNGSATIASIHSRGAVTIDAGDVKVTTIVASTDAQESDFPAGTYDPTKFNPALLSDTSYPLNYINLSNAGIIGSASAKGELAINKTSDLGALASQTSIDCNGVAHDGASAETITNCPATAVLKGCATDGSGTYAGTAGASCTTTWADGDYLGGSEVFVDGVKFKAPYWTNKSPTDCASGAAWVVVQEDATASCAATVYAYDPELNSVVTEVPRAIKELEPFEMTPPGLNTWDDIKEANYIFRPEGSKLKVTVRHIAGLEHDTDYYLGTLAGSDAASREYLCTEVNDAGVCSDAGAAARGNICGMESTVGCFSYDAGTKTWTVKGEKSLAMGVLGFEGNVTFSGAKLFNTVLVTGDIKTTGSSQVVAVNWAGPEIICEGLYSLTYTNSKGGSTTIAPDVSSDILSGLQSQTPSNYCTTPEFTAHDIGNVSLQAGGTKEEGDDFTGGLIELKNTSDLLGTVIAGNLFKAATGSVSIYGYFAALGLGNTEGGANLLGAEINIDTTSNNRDHFTPGGKGIIPPTEDPIAGVSEVLWTRYF